MGNIYDILDIKAGVFNDFALLAREVADRQTEKVVNANMRKLKTIEDKMLTDCQVKASTQSIEEIINKVRYYARHTEGADFSPHELRLVSYYMMKLQGDETSYDYALRLLRENWRNMYFNGLVFYLLNSWNLLMPEYRNKVCHLVQEKLAEYRDNNRRYLQLKNRADFFDENGPMRMAALIVVKNLNLFEAPTIIGYKASTFSLSFYSDVIIQFFKKKGAWDLDIVESVFEKHDIDRTKKLLFAYLVAEAEQSGDQMLQTRISKVASGILGDISLSSTWAPFVGASQGEIERLRKAKALVNHWFVRRLIDVFFEVCVQDKARKIYWINILEKGWIKDIRIAGSTLVRRKLQADARVSDMFGRYFIDTSSRISQTAAMILCVKNKVMIEFSDTGALYVYNRDRSVISFIKKGRRHIDSINDLKMPSIGLLIVNESWYYNSYEEGRHFHKGNWQKRLDDWMRMYLSDTKITSITFSDESDEKVFQEKRIKAEEYTIRTPEPSPNEADPSDETTLEHDDASSDFWHNTALKLEQGDSFGYMRGGVKEVEVEYHINVSAILASKWLYDSRCRVVTDAKNFYIEVMGSRQCALLRSFMPKEGVLGSIWIRRPNEYNFQEIVYEISYEKYSVGFIREEDGTAVYTESMDSKEVKRIKLS